MRTSYEPKWKKNKYYFGKGEKCGPVSKITEKVCFLAPTATSPKY